MSKPTEKEVKLDVSLPQNGFPRTLYFNRLRVDRDEGFCLVQFGLIVASDLVDSYSCVLTDEMLKHNQQTLLDYVKKLGPAEVEDTSWKGAIASRKADVADTVMMSSRGDLSETIFYAFSMCAATNAVASGASGPLPSQPLVLLRSSKLLQKQLITALYSEA
jgi:hypothetical protein